MNKRCADRRLYANDFGFGANGFDVFADTSNQATTTNSDKDGINRGLVMLQNFLGDGSLAGDDIGIIKGVNKA